MACCSKGEPHSHTGANEASVCGETAEVQVRMTRGAGEIFRKKVAVRSAALKGALVNADTSIIFHDWSLDVGHR